MLFLFFYYMAAIPVAMALVVCFAVLIGRPRSLADRFIAKRRRITIVTALAIALASFTAPVKVPGIYLLLGLKLAAYLFLAYPFFGWIYKRFGAAKGARPERKSLRIRIASRRSREERATSPIRTAPLNL